MRGVRGGVGAATLCVVAIFSVLPGMALAAWVTDVNPIGRLELTFNADFSPRALPKTERAAVAFTIAGAIRTTDGSLPPALEELVFELDRNSSLDGSALPRCGKSSRDIARTLDEIKKICKDAIVGGGKATFWIAFPENSPIPAVTDLVVFNGGAERGVTTLYAAGWIATPLNRMIVLPIEISKKVKGRIGTKATLAVPKVAGGFGLLTDLSLTLRRRIAGKNPRAGIMSLKCPNGRFLVRIRGTFADGTLVRGEFPRRCRAKHVVG
jgi:hypothetical protein